MAKTILTVDTASPFCSVALHDGVSPPLSLVSEGEGNHFEKLPGLVSMLLTKAQISMGEVGAVGVGVGPGSFTGIRIGMSFAKGIAWANQLPLIGFCSLAACGVCALLGEDGANSVAVISDAGRDEVFLSTFSRNPNHKTDPKASVLTTVIAPTIVPRLKLSKLLSGYSILSSPQVALLTSEAIKEVLPNSTVLVPAREPALGAFGVLEVTEATFNRGSVGVIELEPVYLRQVAAKTIAERLAEGGTKK